VTDPIDPAFLAAFHMLEAAFPDWKPKPSAPGIPGTVDVYWQSLREFDRGDYAAAVGESIRTGAFAPRVAELLELAGKYRAARQKVEFERQERESLAREDERLRLDRLDPVKCAERAAAIKAIAMGNFGSVRR
jgi:hypothetical protein